jgi:hypothetical protein
MLRVLAAITKPAASGAAGGAVGGAVGATVANEFYAASQTIGVLPQLHVPFNRKA